MGSPEASNAWSFLPVLVLPLSAVLPLHVFPRSAVAGVITCNSCTPAKPVTQWNFCLCLCSPEATNAVFYDPHYGVHFVYIPGTKVSNIQRATAHSAALCVVSPVWIIVWYHPYSIMNIKSVSKRLKSCY
jgi:hypothetical protein